MKPSSVVVESQSFEGDVSTNGLSVRSLGQLHPATEAMFYPLLRIAFGTIVFTHGLPKLLGTPYGSMADPTAASIHLIRDVMGLPFGPQIAALVVLLETAGALMRAAGLLTRVVSLAIALETIGISAALGSTWPWTDRGIEYPC
jgi:putative oxidoreductase